MKLAIAGLVALGILAAASAAMLMATLTAQPQAASSQPSAESDTDVLLATRDMQPMTVIDGNSFTVKKVPKSQVPESALLNPVQIVGKVLTERMVANQPFTKSCFAREGKGVYLAAAVPPGKRAISISLTDWSSMAGLLYPGSVVDVLVSFKALGGNREQDELKTTTLLQGLMVMAIGSQSVADDEYKDKNPGAMSQTGQINHRMVTLLVDPKQAEILQLAMQSGSISLALRNPQDAKQEARRLSRAREIAPGFTDMSAPVDPDPFENRPIAQSNDEPRTPGPGSANEWETLVIRGSKSERRLFPLPAKPDDAKADESTIDQPQADDANSVVTQ